MTRKFTFAKKERLKSRKAIEQLFANNKSFHLYPFKILYIEIPEPGLRAGAGVSSRNFKKAKDRNRVKRLTKEAWRLQKNTLKDKLQAGKQGLHVFLLYTGKAMPAYSEITEAMPKILLKLEKQIESK